MTQGGTRCYMTQGDMPSYGVNKNTVWNPYINAEAAAKMLSKRVSTINKTIDRKDSANLGAYIYIAHNQGLSGFKIIYNACKNHKDLSPEAALVKSAFELKDNENLGRKVYKNMKGGKENSIGWIIWVIVFLILQFVSNFF